MKIHFVCSGNTNRSRLAEAYLRSKQLPDIKVSSSGTQAANNENGALTWFASEVLVREGLKQYASADWTQTTKELLKQSDLIIFMKQYHFDFVHEQLNYQPSRYEIWDIEDVPTDPAGDDPEAQQEKTKQDEDIFQTIKKKVNELVLKIS